MYLGKVKQGNTDMAQKTKIEAYKTFGGWTWDAELADGSFKNGGASVFSTKKAAVEAAKRYTRGE